MTDSGDALFCESLNSSGSSSILFIHGAGSNHEEWDLTTPHIPSTYHILLPDLPLHGKSGEIRPFTVQNAADYLARTIAEKGKNGRAHIVGLSLGAVVAVDLASRYPERVDTMIVSGFNTFQISDTARSLIPYAAWAFNRIERAMPKAITTYLMDGAEMKSTPAPSLELCKSVCGIMQAEGEGRSREEQKPWPARTLIICAAKGGLLPTADRPDDAQRMAKLGRQMNAETRAVLHKEMRHPWNRQDGKLYADTVVEWIVRGKVVEGRGWEEIEVDG